MECLADELVYLYLQGSVQGASRSSVRRHIEACSACRRTVAEVARSLEDEAPSPVRATEPVQEALRVGRYELLERLGAGSCGVVYRARDPELGRDVALKVLRPDVQGDAPASRRLTREAKAMARLSHPNVVTVFDAGVQDEQVFLAMELVDGRNLEDWLTAEPRSLEDVLEMFVQAGRGLAAAHDAGLVHRDFKPANVMVGRDGRARVTDFGLAQPVLGDRSAAQSSESSVGEIASHFATMTHTGSFGGTPAFMAPEIFRGRTADARSDQYSFCVALYRSLYGQSPTPIGDVRELVTAVMKGDLRWPQGTGVSRSVEALLRRGLALSSDHRFPSMTVLVAALASERQARRPRNRASARTLALIGFVLALVASAAGLALVGAFSSSTNEALRASIPPEPIAKPAAHDAPAFGAPSAAPPPEPPAPSTSSPITEARSAPRAPTPGAQRAASPPAGSAAKAPKPADKDALLPDPWNAK